MAAAARIHIVEKGKDPRAYAMVGFGGAGPAHAAEVARVLGVRRGADPAGVRCGLGTGLPRRAAVVRAGTLPSGAARGAGCGGSRRRDPARTGAEAARTAWPRPESPRDVVTRAPGRHAPGRPDARDQRARCPTARSPTRPCRRSARRFATAYAAPLHLRLCAASASMAVSFRVRCRGPLPRLSLTEAGGRVRRRGTEGQRAGLVRRRLRRYAGLRSLCPAHRRDASPARRSSRSARPPRSSRRATASTVDATGNLRSRSAWPPAPAARVDRRHADRTGRRR